MPVPYPVDEMCDSSSLLRPRYCGNHIHLMNDWLAKYCNQGVSKADGMHTAVSSEYENGGVVIKRARTSVIHSDSPSAATYGESCTKGGKDRGKRIPCPIDPSHLIFESAISKHVLVCPAAKQKEEAEGRSYYKEGVNCGGFGATNNLDEINVTNLDNLNDFERANQLAFAVLRIFHYIFISPESWDNSSSGLTEAKLKELTEGDIYNAIQLLDLSATEEENEDQKDETGRLTNALNRHRIKSGGPRHIQQIASILGHLRALDLIPKNVSHFTKLRSPEFLAKEKINEDGLNTKTTIIEMGAGRGMLGLVCASAAAYSWGNTMVSENQQKPELAHKELDIEPALNIDPPKVELVLVERAGTRAKAETKIRTAIKVAISDAKNESSNHFCSVTRDRYIKNQRHRECLALDRVAVTRIKCDLAHVDMYAALPFLVSSAGSLSKSDHSENDAAQKQKRKTMVVAKHLCGAGTDLALKSLRDLASAGAIDGCVMATCCHGLCSWKEYVGRDHLRSLFCGKVGGLSSFGENDFNMLRRWTSASVLDGDAKQPNRQKSADLKNGNDPSDGNEEHNNDSVEITGRGPTIFEVAEELGLKCGGRGIGRACQRLIDHGRCHYMEKQLFKRNNQKEFKVTLSHYVDASVTPQNALIAASRIK